MGRRPKRRPNDELEGRKMAASEGALHTDDDDDDSEDVLGSCLLYQKK